MSFLNSYRSRPQPQNQNFEGTAFLFDNPAHIYIALLSKDVVFIQAAYFAVIQVLVRTFRMPTQRITAIQATSHHELSTVTFKQSKKFPLCCPVVL